MKERIECILELKEGREEFNLWSNILFVSLTCINYLDLLALVRLPYICIHTYCENETRHWEKFLDSFNEACFSKREFIVDLIIEFGHYINDME